MSIIRILPFLPFQQRNLRFLIIAWHWNAGPRTTI
jgi:hypothetical protein